jgi:hypothetical protein
MPVFRSAVAALALLLSGAASSLWGQELKTHPTPFTTWLDFRTLTRTPTTKSPLPIWIESVQRHVVTVGKTTYRIRFRHLGGLDERLEFRLFYRDLAAAHPTVTGWTETGSQPFAAGPFGEGLGVDSSETMLVPAAALDYLDVEVPGDGSSVRGAFLSSLRRSEVWHALDFSAPDPFADPFGAPTPLTPGEDDKYLYGRVRATLDTAPLKLDSKSPEGAYEFSLDKPPLIAAVTFEILGASPTSALNTFLNGQYLGPASIAFPDLADPGYRGESRPLERALRFRYEGWLRARVILSGNVLVGGLNTFALQLKDDAGAVVVRAVEIELKYPSNVFDYELKP